MRSSVVRWLLPGIAHFEPMLVLMLAPFLLFPRPDWTPWVLTILAVLWLVRWLARGRLTVRTPLDGPMLCLVATLVVSLWATFDLALSFPKICGLVLGMAMFYALANALRTDRDVWLATGLLLVGGAAVAGVALVGTQWGSGKVPSLVQALAPLYERLPLLLRDVPRAEEGFNPNQVAGTLALFIPPATSLLLCQLRHPRRRINWVLPTMGLAGVLVLTTLVLFLTQSRLAYLATAVSLLLLGASQGRWFRLAGIAVLALGIGLIASRPLDATGHALFGVSNLEALSGNASWAGRIEIWKRSLRVLYDHPLTGVGFDTLFEVVHARYPTFLINRIE